jgi:hypothetical protein
MDTIKKQDCYSAANGESAKAASRLEKSGETTAIDATLKRVHPYFWTPLLALGMISSDKTDCNETA